MVSLFQRLAHGIYPHRLLLWILVACAAAAVAVVPLVVQGSGAEPYTFLAIAVAMWAVCLLTIAHAFRAPVPEAAPGAGRLAKFGVRMRRACLAAMAVLMTGLFLMVILVTIRAMQVWIRGL